MRWNGAKKAIPTSNGLYPILLVFAILGNVYPVSHKSSKNNRFKGKGCHDGFDSHFSLINPETLLPMQVNDANKKGWSEFVLFNESRLLPSVLLLVKP